DLAPRRVDHPVARDDLFAERHRPARRLGRREHDLALEPGHVEVEQSSVLDDATRDLALTLGEGGERDRLAAADPVDDREVGGRENAHVLAVLPIDPLDVLRHHQLDAGAHLGVGGLLTRRALATPLAADRGDEAAALHRPPRDRELLAALQAQVGEVAQGFVVVVADVGGRDLVGRDVVAQLAGGGPIQVLPGELGANERGVFGQKQDASLEPDEIGKSLDPAGLQRLQHERKLHRLLGTEQGEPGETTMLSMRCRLAVTILLVTAVASLRGQRPAAAPSSLPPVSSAPQCLKQLDDFVAWAERPEPQITADGEVVFVGYGVRAPEWRWDDYKDGDVRGKVLLMLVNDPGLQDSTVFNGRVLTYYGRW